MTTTTLLQVLIKDDFTGQVLADVDGTSTADALAYFLRNRGLDDEATEQSVYPDGPWGFTGFNPEMPITWEWRNHISGALERAIVAVAK